MRFNIATKISFLTCTLVALTSYFLPTYVLVSSKEHVVNHEIVDLVDETNLSAQRVLRSIDEFRRDIDELVREISASRLASAEKHQATLTSEQELKTLFKKFFKRRSDYLQAELIRFSHSGTIDASHVIALNDAAWVAKMSAPTCRHEFLRSIVERRPLGAETSEFGQSHVLYLRPDAERPQTQDSLSAAPDVRPPDGIKLVIQGAALVPELFAESASDREGEEGNRWVVLVTLHFRQLDSDASSVEQLAISPRHFQYLANARGDLLQHPDPFPVYNLSADEGYTVDRTEPVIRDRFLQLRQLMAGDDQDESARLEREYGRTERYQKIPSLKSWFGFTREVSAKLLDVFDPKPGDTDREAAHQLVRTFNEGLFAYLRQHPDCTVSFPSHDIPRFKVRSHNRDRKSILLLQTEIDRQLTAASIGPVPTWEVPVELKTFALHMIRLAYEPRHPKSRFVDLVVGVSYEEIASDVDAEMRMIQLAAIACSLGAGALAVLLSRMITRPLNRIIDSTRHVADGDFDPSLLPIDDRGEVGELARAFRIMVNQLQERRCALQEEQNKIRNLNADLKVERDNLEIRVKERTSQLLQTNGELELARDSALDANRAKSAFLAQMSHELRTPLNAIIGYGELIIEESADGQNTQFVPDVKKIIEAGRHLLGLINDILDLSKIEAGKMELNPETFEVQPLVESVVSTIAPLIRKNANRLDWECTDEILPLHADRTRVRQLLLNLLSNASKFTEHGEIVLKVTNQTENAQKFVAFEVRDTGVGMTSDQMKQLFKSFSQVDSSITRKYQGTGLGLVICKRFCEMMGGDISVTSEYGKGSVFTIRLPVRSPNAPETANSRIPVVSGTTTGTVLVIDDDSSARELIQRQLSKAGFEVIAAPSGPEGLRLVREIKPTFITLDVKMPGMDGWEVLGALKSDPQSCEIPVIMLTMVDDRNLGLALGAADFLHKPVDKEKLLGLAQRYRNEMLKPPSILVIEDDASTRNVIARMLQGAGWHVCEAQNGQDAMAQLGHTRPSMILLDLMMPEMDGFTFLKELRQLRDYVKTPVVIVTAKELSADERTILNGGVDQILQKGSYTREQLLETIHELVPLHKHELAVSVE